MTKEESIKNHKLLWGKLVMRLKWSDEEEFPLGDRLRLLKKRIGQKLGIEPPLCWDYLCYYCGLSLPRDLKTPLDTGDKYENHVDCTDCVLQCKKEYSNHYKVWSGNKQEAIRGAEGVRDLVDMREDKGQRP